MNNNNGQEHAVIDALSDVRWVFRTVRGVSGATNLAEPRVTAILKDLYQRKLVRRRGTDLWGLSDEEGAVIQVLRNPRFKFRTIRGIATATDLDTARVQEIISSLERKNLVRLSYESQRGAESALWGLLELLSELRQNLDGIGKTLDTLKETPSEAVELVKRTQTLAAAVEKDSKTTLRKYYDQTVEYYDRVVKITDKTGEVAAAALTAYQVVQFVAGLFGFPLP